MTLLLSLFFFTESFMSLLPFYANANIGDEDTRLLSNVTIRDCYSILIFDLLFDAKVHMEHMLLLVTRQLRTAEYLFKHKLLFIYIYIISPLNISHFSLFSFFFISLTRQNIFPQSVWFLKSCLKGFKKISSMILKSHKDSNFPRISKRQSNHSQSCNLS